MYILDAFDAICQTAVPVNGCFVALMERVPFYGGPEEGGWYGTDIVVVAYQYFETREAAEYAKTRIETLAAELEAQNKVEYGEQCLRDMDWLEARGLESNFLPEPDGPSEYYVTITDSYPEGSIGKRGYK